MNTWRNFSTFRASMTRSRASSSPSRMLKSVNNSGLVRLSILNLAWRGEKKERLETDIRICFFCQYYICWRWSRSFVFFPSAVHWAQQDACPSVLQSLSQSVPPVPVSGAQLVMFSWEQSNVSVPVSLIILHFFIIATYCVCTAEFSGSRNPPAMSSRKRGAVACDSLFRLGDYLPIMCACISTSFWEIVFASWAGRQKALGISALNEQDVMDYTVRAAELQTQLLKCSGSHVSNC